VGQKPRKRPKHLPAKLLAVRQTLGLTQRQMAALLDRNLPHLQLSEFESGRREPSLLVLLAYARLANCSVEQLIDDTIQWP
jgi:transcriptional regulator with XRE-family HTH domain